MKYTSILSLLLMVAELGVCSQSGMKETKSPREVVEEFWKLETDGGRLTPKGWYKAGIFFVRPSSPPQKKVITITSAKYKCSVDERWVKGNQAEISNECIELGQIDDALHYTPPDARYYKTDVLHHLVQPTNTGRSDQME